MDHFAEKRKNFNDRFHFYIYLMPKVCSDAIQGASYALKGR